MTVFEEHRWVPERTLSCQEVAYFRRVLATHANDLAAGACRLCLVPACQDWRTAFDHLAAAGELMAEPEQWLTDEHSRDSR